MKLSIIIPAHNEEENITDVVEKIERELDFDYELIVVNDHSIDKTADCVNRLAARYPNIRLVENTPDKGFASAIRTGFSNARSEAVIPVMADLCDDLSTIKKMLDKIKDGYDVACGCRYTKGGSRLGGSRLKGFFSKFAGVSLYYLLGLPTRDIANAFKMYRKEVIDKVNIESKGFEISMEIPLKAYYQGFKICDVPTVWRERTKGKSSFKMLKLLPAYFKLYIWALLKSLGKIRCRYYP